MNHCKVDLHNKIVVKLSRSFFVRRCDPRIRDFVHPLQPASSLAASVEVGRVCGSRERDTSIKAGDLGV